MGVPPGLIEFIPEYVTVDWESASQRISAYPEEACIQGCKAFGNSVNYPLDFAVRTKRSGEIPIHFITALAKAWPQAISSSTLFTALENPFASAQVFQSLLRHAGDRLVLEDSTFIFDLLTVCFSKNDFELMNIVLACYPDSMSAHNKSGWTFVHLLCSQASLEWIQFSARMVNLQENKQEGGDGGLLLQDRSCGVTPFDLVLSRFIYEDSDEEDMDDVWDCLIFCLQVINDSRKRSSYCHGGPFSLLITSAIGLVPPILLIEMIQRYSSTITTALPSCGSRIIAALIQDAASNDWEGEDDEWKEVIRLIIIIFGKECCCEPVDNAQKRLHLHLAVANGLPWRSGLRTIYKANFKAVAEADNVTGLYPSILAATTERPDLSSIFELLRRNPLIL
jgi:hypothetical protein